MKRTLSRRGIDRLENVLIVLLVCLALCLIHQTGIFQNVAGSKTGTGTEELFTGVQDTALYRGTPARLVVQSSQGRYGVQYEQTQTEQLYQDGLDDLLLDAVDAMDSAKVTTQEVWQSALAQESSWVYYDFLYNVSFTSQSSRGEGTGRLFLITSRAGRADTLYYYNDETQDYYVGQLRESLPLPQCLESLDTNGAKFAFEMPEVSQLLWPNMVLLPQPARCPVYTAENPLDDLDAEGQNALLESLDFNLRAAAVYETTDGMVIQEGSDTLRIQENGKLTFHAAESGEARYQALSAREKDLQIKAEEVLALAIRDRIGVGSLRCQTTEILEDGTVELTFCYLLNGIPVQLWQEGWGARFVFEGSDLRSFVIYLRQYEATDRVQQALPERQAAAAADAIQQVGKELQLNFLDDGTTPELVIGWTVREGS